MLVDSSNTFDTTNALSSMYLWIIFAYLSTLLNCDLQRFIKSHPLVMHVVGLTAFFFLFTLLDSKNQTSLGLVWFKTLVIYVLFVLMTKSRWYFVVPVLGLLLLDQSLKRDIGFKEASGKDVSIEKERQLAISHYLNILIIVLIFIGTAHYMFIQYNDHKKNFSLFTFFFGWKNCKSIKPSS